MADTVTTKVPRTPNASAIGVILVDYSGGDQSFTKLVRGVHVNTSGNMKADFSDGSTGTLAVVAGQTYAYEITKVYQTGSTFAGYALV